MLNLTENLKRVVLSALITLVLLSSLFTASVFADKPMIAVTIVPQMNMLEAIAGDRVDIVEMIPAGYSPANYAPSPREIVAFNDSEIYFSIGVPADMQNILPNAEEIDSLKIVRLYEIVGEKYPHRIINHSHGEEEVHEDAHENEDEHAHEDEHENEDEHAHEDEHENEDAHKHEEGSRDPHIWLSPKRAAYMVEIMRDHLIELMPEYEAEFRENAADYLQSLNEVDQKNREKLAEFEGESILVYHPSYGYFTEEYGLDMIAIEEGGKEPGPKHLEEIIEMAEERNISNVFYQAEIDSKKTRAVAEELGGDTIKLNPLAEDYINNIDHIAQKFFEVLSERDE